MDTEGDATSFYDPNGEVDIEEGKNCDGVKIQEISIESFSHQVYCSNRVLIRKGFDLFWNYSVLIRRRILVSLRIKV